MEIIESISRMQVLGFVILIIGLTLEFWVNKRKFNRKNKYGVFEFKNYEQQLVLRGWERLVKLIGYVFVFSGLFLLALDLLSR